MRKKLWKFLLAAGILFALLAFGVWVIGGKLSVSRQSTVYGRTVAAIMENEAIGMTDCFIGVVEPQGMTEIVREEQYGIGEIYVTEGQEIKAGDRLFCYDVDTMQKELEKAELALESVNNEIDRLAIQVEQLKQEVSDEEEIPNYSMLFQSAELELEALGIEKSTKEADVLEWKEAIENAEVTSPSAGTILSINPYAEAGEVFVMVIDAGNYRIKGSVQELALQNVREDMPVTVYLRADQTQTWEGRIETVDTANPIRDRREESIATTDELSLITNYFFYVTLADSSGLYVGQHVYIEPDVMGEASGDGIRLPEYYLVFRGKDAFVWAADKDGNLEMRPVETGAYEESRHEYEIVEGLDAADILVYPEKSLKKGDEVLLTGTEGKGAGDAG